MLALNRTYQSITATSCVRVHMIAPGCRTDSITIAPMICESVLYSGIMNRNRPMLQRAVSGARDRDGEVAALCSLHDDVDVLLWIDVRIGVEDGQCVHGLEVCQD